MQIPVVVVGRAQSRAELQAFADATALVNDTLLRSRRFVHPYDAGIRYRIERRGEPLPGVERFQTIDSLYALGFGDCDDLAPALASWKRVVEGIPARPWVIRNPRGGYHVITLYRGSDGSLQVEDPSARLGMLEQGDEEMQDDTEYAAGCSVRVNGRHVAAVGFVSGPVRVVAVGEAHEGEYPGDDERSARTRAARRAVGNAFGKAMGLAQRFGSAYVHRYTSAGKALVRGASSIARKARRADADMQTMHDLGVDDDPSSDDVDDDDTDETVNGFDSLAWRLYVRR